MADGGKGGVDDVVLCSDLREYLQPELLARKSCHYLILLTPLRQACESLGPTIFYFVSRYAEIILCGRHKIISCALQLYIGRIPTTLCMVRFKSQLHRGEHTSTLGMCRGDQKK
jgi:hypothetical protein